MDNEIEMQILAIILLLPVGYFVTKILKFYD